MRRQAVFPTEQQAKIMIVGAELFPLAVEHLDMCRQNSDRERVQGQDVLCGERRFRCWPA